MSHVLPFKGPDARPSSVPRVLYVGPAADEICHVLEQHIGRVDIVYEADVQAAFAHLRRRPFDIVVVDQRDDNLATRLILPVLQSLGYPVKPVVISPLRDVGHYLAIPGVARVLSAPVKEQQFLKVLGLERRREAPSVGVEKAVPQQSIKPAKPKSLITWLSDRFMNLVSTAYKRSAFVLLCTLFVAFMFYGVLIAFFLLSSGWGAPLTLARGHELVNKIEREITEVKIAFHQTEQRLQNEALAKLTAEKELAEAEDLVRYAAGTVKKEMQLRARQSKVLVQQVKRLSRVQGQLQSQVNGSGASKDLERLYKRRLIDKNVYSASTLNLIEASQRLASIEGEIELAKSQIEEFSASQDMLKSLDAALKAGKGVGNITATSSDLLLLAKQASESIAGRALAKSQLSSVAENAQTSGKSLVVLQSQLDTLQQSALARALDRRIDVVFVPYGNERHFAEGKPLYSCALTILWCSKAGSVGKPLPGEISSVHPFFGKPIRGSFVEMILDTPDAAMREIIHGSSSPLFL